MYFGSREITIRFRYRMASLETRHLVSFLAQYHSHTHWRMNVTQNKRNIHNNTTKKQLVKR